MITKFGSRKPNRTFESMRGSDRFHAMKLDANYLPTSTSAPLAWSGSAVGG